MFRKLASGFTLVFNLTLIALFLAAAIPGTHRIILPAAFGVTEVSDGVWTDAPDRAQELRALSNTARRNVAAFYGPDLRKPNLILCSTRPCAERFGIGGNGLSIAHVGIMVGPGGLTEGTLTHEMSHFRLHRSLGWRNIFNQPYPTWFDEGLATHLADHPKWNGVVTPEARLRVRKVERFWHLRDAFDELGVGLTYRAAAAEVAQIERTIGRDGLKELVDRAEAGEDFDAVVIELSTR